MDSHLHRSDLELKYHGNIKMEKARAQNLQAGLDRRDAGHRDAPMAARRRRARHRHILFIQGGGGRSTALISTAWQFTASGKRVCVVDLDLEAPGLGALLNAETERGVLDFLVDFVATGGSDLTGCHAPANVMGNDAENT